MAEPAPTTSFKALHTARTTSAGFVIETLQTENRELREQLRTSNTALGHLRRTIEAMSIRLEQAARGLTITPGVLASENLAGDAWADNHSRRAEWRQIAGLAPRSDTPGDVIPAARFSAVALIEGTDR